MTLSRRRCWGTGDEDLELGLWGWNGAKHVAGCSGGERHSVMWDAGDGRVGRGHWKGEHKYLTLSVVTEKPVSPRRRVRHLFFFTGDNSLPETEAGVGKRSAGGVGSTRGREKLLEVRGFGRLRDHFLQIYHPLSATS